MTPAPGTRVRLTGPVQLMGGTIRAGRVLTVLAVFRDGHGETHVSLTDDARQAVVVLPAGRVEEAEKGTR